MSRPRAKTKSEKCKYKRCMAKKFYPVDKPRYCGKHVDKLEYKEPVVVSTQEYATHAYPVSYDIQPKPSFIQKIKEFIFVQK